MKAIITLSFLVTLLGLTVAQAKLSNPANRNGLDELVYQSYDEEKQSQALYEQAQQGLKKLNQPLAQKIVISDEESTPIVVRWESEDIQVAEESSLNEETMERVGSQSNP